MKRLFYLMLSLALLAGCSKDSDDEPEQPKIVTLELSRDELTFEEEGGEKTFTISCNSEWTLENGSSWCKTDFKKGTGNLLITVTVDSYDGADDRNANLTVKAGDKTQVLGVTQKGKDAIVLGKDKYEVPQEGKTISVEVKSNISYEVTVPEEYRGWIAPAPESRALTTKSYDFTVSATDSTDARSGFIVFSGNSLKDTVWVYQAQRDRLILTEDPCEVFRMGGKITVELRTNVDYTVIIPDSIDWVSRVETRALRTDKLTFSVAENEGQETRLVAILIKDRNSSLSDTLYIRQSALNSFVETVNGVEFEMIYVKGGTFQMGATSEQNSSDPDTDEYPVHSVTLSDYCIGKTEVTQGLWKAVMGSNPSFNKGDDYPVEGVTWNVIQIFLTKLNQLTGKKYVLPTEAQWEYAARGGNKSKGYKYSGSNDIDNVAWYRGNSKGKDSTFPVGTKQPNELGIYDMSGNACEWCSDWYSSSYYYNSPVTNPTGPTSGFGRVKRGGGYYYDAESCRVSIRDSDGPDYRFDPGGFRLALIP